MNTMKSLTEVMDILKKRGYTYNFDLSPEFLLRKEDGTSLSPEDFVIDCFYRFEGMSDPADTMILYAISSEKYGLKGQLVNGYGVNSDPITAAIVDKLTAQKSRYNHSDMPALQYADSDSDNAGVTSSCD